MSSAGEQTFTWRRFWLPRSAPVELESGCFLWDPEGEFTRHLNPEAVALGELDHRVAILLGEPGIGKSHGVRAHAAAATNVAVVNLPDEVSASELRLSVDDALAAYAGPVEIIFDGLDEAMIRYTSSDKWLPAALRRRPPAELSRIRLRVTCRPAVWPESLADGLATLWPAEEPAVLTLAPLRRVDVLHAASQLGIDGEVFLAALQAYDVLPFAARPVTLRPLLLDFAEGKVPRSKTEVYESLCRRLSRELSPGHREATLSAPPPGPSALAVAGRLATLSEFGGRPVLFRGTDPAQRRPSDLDVDDAVRPGVIDRPAIERAMNTGLFEAAGEDRLRFAHRTYGEFLAAHHAHKAGVATRDLLDLVRDPATGVVQPQLGEVAAWLAALRQEVFDELVAVEPELLLDSDVATRDDNDQIRLGTAILERQDHEPVPALDQASLRRLASAALLPIVTPYLAGDEHTIQARLTALELIQDAPEAASVLVDLVTDPAADESLREAAARQLGEDENQENRRRLMALLGDPATSEGLRGVLLGLLWPENISLDEALAAASTHPVHERLYDSYHLFLTQTLPQRVESADLPRALEWATEVASRSTAHGDAADELLARAAGELSAPGVAVPAAHLLLVRHDDVHSRRRSKVEAALRTARENRVARRVLLEGMVASAESGSRRHYATFAVGLPEDFGWALGKACDPDRDTQERRRWVDVAWRWFRPLQCPDHLDTLWAAAADPIVQLVFSDVLKGVRTDSPMVDAARARLVEEKEWAAQTQAWERESEVDRDAVARLLSRPDADAWIPLSRELDPHLGAGMELRMERVAGWKELNVEERAAAAAIAQRWVLEAMPPAPIEPGVWPGDVAYALRALWLAADATEALEALTPEQWAAWGQILLSIAAVDNDDADERCRETLLGRAYSQVPEAIRAVLREELGVDAERVRAALQAEPVDDERQLDPLRAPMPVHTHTKLAELWDDGLLEALLGWQREQADDVGLADTVPFLAARGRLDAVDLALTALADSADEPNAARRRVAAAVALLRCPGGASYWSDVWSRWEADEAFGLAVVDRLAAGLRWELPEVLSQLDTDALADVYLLPPEKVRARSLRLLGPKLTEPADEAALTLPSGAVPRPAPRCPRSWR